MENGTTIYRSFRCSKCERRLNKPLALKCGHFICRNCLEIILRNRRTNSCCPVCVRPLDDYQIENYSYLPPNHCISRLLATFTDVNRCETCKAFTVVKPCSECSIDQCDSCYFQHQETHRPTNKQANKSLDLSREEMQILESIKNFLSEKEFENLVDVARNYLDNAILKEHSRNLSINTAQSIVFVENEVTLSESEVYDWSKHERLTAHSIINAKSEHVKNLLRLDFTPRPYQIRMARPGLEGTNSLICLQTGAGKTFIAGIVAKFLHIRSLQKSDNASTSNSTRRLKVVFLVPIKALVTQQCVAFRKVFIDQPDSILKRIDTQPGEKFRNLYHQYDIFFFTVQMFANLLEAKHAELTSFDLIIIDECHHCYDNHPINSMMRQYHRLKFLNSSVPQIIGLTASVGTNKKNAFHHLVHVCANLDCLEICAILNGAEDDEVRNSTNTPLSDTILNIPKELADSISTKAKDDVMKSIASRLGYDISTMDRQNLENFLVAEHQNACKKNDRDAIIGTDYLRKFHRFLIYYEDLPLEQCLKQLTDDLDEATASNPTQMEKFCRTKAVEFMQFIGIEVSRSVPVKAKLIKLIEMILKLHTPGCRGLILVRTKFHAVALEEFLKKHPELKERKIYAGHLTGQGSSDELSLPGAQQATVLNDFRQGKKNLLVATDVAQEGLDVAECSYVIRYEFVSNEIGTVQSRGRARAAQSKCYLITETLSTNHQREMENRGKEEDMKQAIVEWREKGVQEFQKLVLEEQSKLSTKSPATNSQPTSPLSPSSNGGTARAIHCRYCDTFLCKGSSLRLQGTTVVCVDTAFEQLVKPPKSVGEKFFCPNKTCHKELGVVILLSRDTPAYALHIVALKFLIGTEQAPSLFRKWSQYQGHVSPL